MNRPLAATIRLAHDAASVRTDSLGRFRIARGTADDLFVMVLPDDYRGPAGFMVGDTTLRAGAQPTRIILHRAMPLASEGIGAHGSLVAGPGMDDGIIVAFGRDPGGRTPRDRNVVHVTLASRPGGCRSRVKADAGGDSTNVKLIATLVKEADCGDPVSRAAWDNASFVGRSGSPTVEITAFGNAARFRVEFAGPEPCVTVVARTSGVSLAAGQASPGIAASREMRESAAALRGYPYVLLEPCRRQP